MGALIRTIVAGLVRYGVSAVIALLVRHRIIDASQVDPNAVTEVVAAVVLTIGVVGSLVRSRIRDLRVKQTALALNPERGNTLDDVKKMVQAGVFAPATTPPGEQPQITTPLMRSLEKESQS